MKVYIKFILLFILILILIYSFSYSYTSHSLENIAYVTAIGFDKGETDKYKISFQFVNVAGLNDAASTEPTKTVETYVETHSINNAINLINSYIGKEINLSHCEIIMFSKEIAQQGISKEIFTLMNNEEIRPTAKIMVCDTSAYEYLKNDQPNLERVVTNYYETFALTSKYTGFFKDTNIGTFYNNICTSTVNNTCMYGYVSVSSAENNSSSNNSSGSSSDNSSNDEESSSEVSDELADTNPAGVSGKRPTQNFGIAVFKGDTLVGNLNELESIIHMLITNDVATCTISIPSPHTEEQKIDLTVSRNKNTKVSVDVSKETPTVNLDFNLVANLLTLTPETNLNEVQHLETISKSAENYLKENIESYLYKTSKEYNSDIDGFGNYAISKFLTISDWDNYKWHDKYSNCNFNVNVTLNITSSLLLTELE